MRLLLVTLLCGGVLTACQSSIPVASNAPTTQEVFSPEEVLELASRRDKAGHKDGVYLVEHQY